MPPKFLTIAAKELAASFKSPIAAIVLIITITTFNIFFFVIIDQNQEATLRDIFKLMEFMFVFIVPLFTMKMFAEEKRAGTMEFLMTCPVSKNAVVLGKYLGGLSFLTILIGLTTVYYFIIGYFAQPDRLAAASGYLGIWLEGALFVAVGMLVSSWTKNQIIAAIGTYAVLFTLYFSIAFMKYFQNTTAEVIRHLSVWSHAENLSAGLITSADIVYYLSGIIFFILLTRLSIEDRLWK